MAAKDYLKACFYTADGDVSLPTPVTADLAAHIPELTYCAGEFVYAKELEASMRKTNEYFVITNWHDFQNQGSFRLIIIRVDGPDEDQNSTYEVILHENENVDVFGFRYSIESPARLDGAVIVWDDPE